MIISLHRPMRFRCLPLLWCVALLEFGRCDDTYRAEVYVVASNPRDYGVSITTTYPTTAMNTNQKADNSNPQATATSAPSSSSSSSNPDSSSLPLEDLSDPSPGIQRDAPTISTSESSCSTPANQKELVSSSTLNENEVPSTSRAVPVDVPVTSASRPSAEQQMPGNTCCQTREINNNRCRRNVRTSTDNKTDFNFGASRDINYQTTSCSTPSKNIPSSQSQTQISHCTTCNYTEANEARPSDTQATQCTINKTFTTEHITPTDTSEFQSINNNHLVNRTEPIQQTQSNKLVTIQPISTDQKSGRVQQTSLKQEEATQQPPINQSAVIQQSSANQTGSPTPAVINQVVVLPSSTADTESIQDPQVSQMEVAQPIVTTPFNIAGITQAPGNPTDSYQTEIPTKTGIMNQTHTNQTENLPKTPTNQTEFNQTETLPKIPTNQTEFNQTATSPETPTNQTATGQEILLPQIESLISEIRKLQTNHTFHPRALNTTESERLINRRLQKRRKIARDRTAFLTNQTKLDPMEILDRDSNETSLPHVLNETWSKTKFERSESRRIPRQNYPSRRKRIRKPACTCVEEVVEKTARCKPKQPCTRNKALTNMLLAYAAIILLVYVILLAFVYCRFRRRKREQEEWRRKALDWKCRERRMRWLTKMFS